VFLCFIKPILENRYVRSRGFIVSETREKNTVMSLLLIVCYFLVFFRFFGFWFVMPTHS